MASSAVRHKSREEMKRAKELEEARKAGLAPAEVDAVSGLDINPHIPQYMAAAPWYLNQDKPSLHHQKNWKNELAQVDEKWYSRGAKGKANRKFKAGACEKCGSFLPLHDVLVRISMYVLFLSSRKASERVSSRHLCPNMRRLLQLWCNHPQRQGLPGTSQKEACKAYQ